MYKVPDRSDTTPGRPSCFGEKYDSTSPECVGGHDPAFTDAFGRHVRPVCDFKSACSIRSQATRQSIASPRIISPHQLNRTSSPYSGTRPIPPTPPPQRPVPVYSHQPPPPPPQPYYHRDAPQHYGIPQYLTTREPLENGSVLRRLVVEVVRSIGKSFGHSLAHFFDVEIFTSRKDPSHETDQTRPGPGIHR